jgi:PAS domain S-box-containing protein
MCVIVAESDSPETQPFAAPDWLGAWAHSTDAAYCRDLAGNLLAVNPAFVRKFGRNGALPSPLRLTDLIHAEDRALLDACTEAVGQPPHHAAAEHRWRTAQGIRWFSWDEAAVRNPAGRIAAIRAVGRDVTRQHLAEEQFLRLSLAVEQSPVAIVITDLDGRTQYVNSKYTEASGRTLEDLIDGNVPVLRDGHPDEASYQACRETVRAGGEWRGELSQHRPDGSLLWEAVKVTGLRGPTGALTNFLCLREDITGRKQLEHELRQAQKMESLGTLAGGIAHDFNNLLAIINGYAEFCLQQNEGTALVQKGLREIHRATRRASGLVNQILTFSRKNDPRFAAVDLNHLVRELVALMSETFPRNVSFNLELCDHLPPFAADQNQLQQVILNLCVNARDAMPGGGTITLTTRIETSAPGVTGSAVCLQVSDTGTGIPPEVRARIFEPFFTTKSAQEGTGLGLAVVYGIVTGHRGTIDVDSTPGAGSTFTVTLPLGESVAIAATGHGPVGFPGGNETLLIVDDEASLRTLLASTFGAKGYKTTSVANGREAIALLADPTRYYDAILLDLNLPGATGLEVFATIRTHRPELKVVVTSGHITPQARTAFADHPASAFVAKPYALDDLGRQLRGLLDGRGTNL